MVRHAPTAFNLSGRVMGSLDVEPEPIGDEHAPVGQLEPAALVFCSPLMRAMASARFLFPGARLRVDSRLAERSLGELEGVDHVRVQQRWPTAYIDGRLDPGFDPPGGESMPTFAGRVAGFLREHVVSVSRSASTVYVVTHNGWIRTARFLNGEIERDELFGESVSFLTLEPYVPRAELLASDHRARLLTAR
jgi:broad specificity phosphatase PhoE